MSNVLHIPFGRRATPPGAPPTRPDTAHAFASGWLKGLRASETSFAAGWRLGVQAAWRRPSLIQWDPRRGPLFRFPQALRRRIIHG